MRRLLAPTLAAFLSMPVLAGAYTVIHNDIREGLYNVQVTETPEKYHLILSEKLETAKRFKRISATDEGKDGFENIIVNINGKQCVIGDEAEDACKKKYEGPIHRLIDDVMRTYQSF